MKGEQTSLDIGGQPSARVIFDLICEESRDESEKGRWFEQLFLRIALQQPELEIDGIWRWPDWPAAKHSPLTRTRRTVHQRLRLREERTMRAKKNPCNGSAEKTVKAIRRTTQRRYAKAEWGPIPPMLSAVSPQ